MDKNVDAFWQFVTVNDGGIVFENACTGKAVCLSLDELFTFEHIRLADGKYKISWTYHGPADLPPEIRASLQARMEAYFEGLGAKIIEHWETNANVR